MSDTSLSDLRLRASDLPRIVPLFRALHNYHATHAPDLFHCDGSDADYLAHLQDKRAAGGLFLGHDAGWGLGSYLLALPEMRAADALSRAQPRLRIDHLYVVPGARGRGLASQLIRAMEAHMRQHGIPEWVVGYHSFNTSAEALYARLGAAPRTAIRARRV